MHGKKKGFRIKGARVGLFRVMRNILSLDKKRKRLLRRCGKWGRNKKKKKKNTKEIRKKKKKKQNSPEPTQPNPKRTNSGNKLAHQNQEITLYQRANPRQETEAKLSAHRLTRSKTAVTHRKGPNPRIQSVGLTYRPKWRSPVKV